MAVAPDDAHSDPDGSWRTLLGGLPAILSEVEEADRQATRVHASPSGMVRMTGSVVFGRVALTLILLELQDRYPEISNSTFFVDRLVHLIDEGMDIAIRIAELPDSSLTLLHDRASRRVRLIWRLS